MEVTVKVNRRRQKWEFEETQFEARDRPQAIFIGEQAIVGPFCKHCGFSIVFHGRDARRPPMTCPPPPPLTQRNPLEKRPDAVRVR